MTQLEAKFGIGNAVKVNLGQAGVIMNASISKVITAITVNGMSCLYDVLVDATVFGRESRFVLLSQLPEEVLESAAYNQKATVVGSILIKKDGGLDIQQYSNPVEEEHDILTLEDLEEEQKKSH